MDNFKDLKGVKALIDAKNHLKHDINLSLELLEQYKKRNLLKAIIENLQGEIRALDSNIKEIYIKANLDLNEIGFVTEQRNEFGFRINVNNRLVDIEDSVRETSISHGSEAGFVSDNHSMISIPKLQCATFSVINPSKFEFKNFIAQFNNCSNSINSNKAKLPLLKSYLAGYTLQLISHLTLEEGNYEMAISLLTKEFWDVPFIFHEIVKQILTSSKYDPDFVTVKTLSCRSEG